MVFEAVGELHNVPGKSAGECAVVHRSISHELQRLRQGPSAGLVLENPDKRMTLLSLSAPQNSGHG
jgi:hypothetical protein